MKFIEVINYQLFEINTLYKQIKNNNRYFYFNYIKLC